MLTNSPVIPNLIWNPASDGRDSVLDAVKLPFRKDATASEIGWFPNQVWNDGKKSRNS
jgi:hypothetical protein